MKNKEKAASFIELALSDASREFANEMNGAPKEKCATLNRAYNYVPFIDFGYTSGLRSAHAKWSIENVFFKSIPKLQTTIDMKCSVVFFVYPDCTTAP